MSLLVKRSGLKQKNGARTIKNTTLNMTSIFDVILSVATPNVVLLSVIGPSKGWDNTLALGAIWPEAKRLSYTGEFLSYQLALVKKLHLELFSQRNVSFLK